MENRKSYVVSIASMGAALVCSIEITLGWITHLLHIPFNGAVMAALNLLVYLSIRKYVPRKGIIAITGLAAALLYFFLRTRFRVAVALFVQALIVETAFSFLGTDFLATSLAVVGLALWTALQSLIFFVIANGTFFPGVEYVTERLARIYGIPETFWITLLSMSILTRLVIIGIITAAGLKMLGLLFEKL